MYKINNCGTRVKRCSKETLSASSSLLISLHHILSPLLSLSLPTSPSVSSLYLLSPYLSSHPAVQVTLAQAGRLPLCEGGPLDDKKQEGNLGAVMVLLCVFV